MSDLFRYFKFGFGSSAGRDAYRGTAKSLPLILVITILLVIMLSPVWAGYDRRRGNAERSDSPNRPILNFFLTAYPIALMAYLLFYTSGYNPPALEVESPRAWIIGTTLYVTVAFYIGQFFGRKSAINRYATEDKENHNNNFLIENGIAKGEENWIGPDGEALRSINKTEEKMIFMAVGRRNKRAFITLNDKGYFQTYSGVIDVSEV